MISEKQMERKYGWKRVYVSGEGIEKILGDFEERVKVIFEEFDRAKRESWIEARDYFFSGYLNVYGRVDGVY